MTQSAEYDPIEVTKMFSFTDKIFTVYMQFTHSNFLTPDMGSLFIIKNIYLFSMTNPDSAFAAIAPS